MSRIVLLLLLFVSSSLSAQSENHDRENESGSGLYKLARTHWAYQTGGKVFATPCIENGVLFIGSEDGNLYALNRKSGSLKWKFETKGPIHSSVTHANGVLYFGSFDGHYYAVDAETGKRVWSFQTGGEKWMGGKGYMGMKPDSLDMADPWEYYLSSPIVSKTKGKSTVYFGSSDGNVYALNAADGSLKWKFKSNGIIHSTPYLHNNIILAGSWDTYLYALDAESGDLKWKFKTGDNPGMAGIQSSPIVAKGIVYFGARDANFYAVDLKTGEMKWKFVADNSWILSNAVVKNGTVYFGTSDSFLVVALDALTGKKRWMTPLNGYVYSSPSIVDRTLFIGDFTGRVYSLNLQNGQVMSVFETPGFKQHAGAVLNNGKLDFMKVAAGRDLSQYATTTSVMDEFYKLGPILSSPVISNRTLYVGSADGNVYAITLEEIKTSGFSNNND